MEGQKMTAITSQEIIKKIKNDGKCQCPKCRNGIIKFKGEKLEKSMLLYCSNSECGFKIIIN